MHQKWGFGMAPVKPTTQERRNQAAATVLNLLQSADYPHSSVAGDISEVKGLFTRSFKQDQWDWFTVWTQLGRPGRKRCVSISQTLGYLRGTIIGHHTDQIADLCKLLIQARTVTTLHRFLNPRPNDYFEDEGIGYIYIMSTRSNPSMLKIGSTERTVEQRVKEINSSTGIFEPYGVRAVWTVLTAPQVEKAVHEALTQIGVRQDQESFLN